MALTPSEAALLSGCALFQGMEPGALEPLAAAEGASQAVFRSGQVVYSPHHFRRSLGIVLSGQLQVTKDTLAMSTLEPGDLFGAAALYSDLPQFAATITARRPSRCLLLEQNLVDRLLAQEPLIRENYLRYLTGRIWFLSGRLRSLSQPGAEGKLARYLLANCPQGTLTCPAANLAQRLGISRASLYRAFDALEGSGLIRRSGKTITVTDFAGLEAVL